MRLTALLSGGKDSVYSIQLALQEGHDVSHAVTIFPRRDDSYMYHVPNLWLTSLQTESMGIEHVTRESSGEKERELQDLKEALRPLPIDGVVVGAIASNYQYTRVARICEELGLKVLAPLWGADGHSLLEELLATGYRIMIVGVYADGLGPEWLGRVIDKRVLLELKDLESKRGVGLSFEGGEAETLVVDCPIFRKSIVVEEAETRWEVCRGEYMVSKARLEEKAQHRRSERMN